MSNYPNEEIERLPIPMCQDEQLDVSQIHAEKINEIIKALNFVRCMQYGK